MNSLTTEELKNLFITSCYNINIQNKRSILEFWTLADKEYSLRKFHNWNHISFVTTMAKHHFNDMIENMSEVIIAIIGHDVVQKKTSPENELASIEILLRFLNENRVEDEYIKRIESNIMATVPFHSFLETRDEKIISDCDLMGLGLPWPIFIKNTRSLFIESQQNDFNIFIDNCAAFFEKMKNRAQKKGAFYYFAEKIPEYEKNFHKNIEIVSDIDEFRDSLIKDNY